MLVALSTPVFCKSAAPKNYLHMKETSSDACMPGFTYKLASRMIKSASQAAVQANVQLTANSQQNV